MALFLIFFILFDPLLYFSVYLYFKFYYLFIYFTLIDGFLNFIFKHPCFSYNCLTYFFGMYIKFIQYIFMYFILKKTGGKKKYQGTGGTGVKLVQVIRKAHTLIIMCITIHYASGEH
ncbi:hypothetical protein ACJX0J_008468 [Zea mays]